jgi:hypothetical protein
MAHALAPCDASLHPLVQIAGEAKSSFNRFLSRPFGWLIAVARFLCLALPLVWGALVIYYSNLPWAGAFRGESGRHLLLASISPFDPQRTCPILGRTSEIF